MKRSLLVVIALMAAALPVAAQRRRATAQPRPFPPCRIVSGIPAVTFTRDHGNTLAPIDQPLGGIAYTYGLVALDDPGALLAWHRTTVYRSNDDGCSWTAVADIAAPSPPRLTPAEGGRAYAWSDQERFLARYDASGAVTLRAPGPIVGAGSDPNDGARVRVVDGDGVVWDSRDGGNVWTRSGELPATAITIYRAAFDPNDYAHIVIGTATQGAYVTRDGGVTWQQSTLGDRVNVFEAVVSPADGATVWAEGLDTRQDKRNVYLSRDGGATFRVAVEAVPGVVQLINGNVLAAHPTDRDVLYFVFGSHFQNYGTDLFRYDAGSNSLSWTHNGYDDIDAIAFSRRDPSVMYLGLESERGTD